MKQFLTLDDLVAEARAFCAQEHRYAELFGVTDGKAVGTFVEHRFRDRLDAAYTIVLGSSALGIDLPSVETDIKVTSARQPQSSCPFTSPRQKVYGLGYHLLLFVYDKQDSAQDGIARLGFVSCAFIDRTRTADYQMTRGLLEILDRDGNRDDIVAFLSDRNLPGDEIVHNTLADEIMASPPTQGYLTISNALQWRLQYGRIVGLTEAVSGIVKIT
ncbi:MAG: restriction endonuclease [Armatimonadetes bacterium]|nr:restriction endonuclease [Armatimonadota bacterium]